MEVKTLRLMDPSYALDTEIFGRFVASHYTPSRKPLVMCVGAISPDEGTAIRRLYEKQYPAEAGHVKIAACNIFDEVNPLLRYLNSYDYLICNPLKGDARLPIPFISALTEFESPDFKFDLVYIRNPDLIGLGDWHSIFMRALEFTSEKGAVVTLIRERDTQKYSNLLERLIERRVNSVVSTETGISAVKNHPLFENFHHTVGVFKPISLD